MSDKPLHVQAAEALGWTQIAHAPELRRLVFQRGAIEGSEVYVGRPPGELIIGYECPPVPRYDTDWSATGPLIEKYGITLSPAGSASSRGEWAAYMGDADEAGGPYEEADSPLLAVCHLILALKEAGKL